MANLKKDKVWYAVYGTNLNEKRFSCYIRGGVPGGTFKQDIGCRDKTPAVDGGKIAIPFQLYFAKSSAKWEHKAVGFLGPQPKPTVITLGRKYLINKDQFEDVFKQENNLKIREEIGIDFEEVKESGSLIVKKSWYGKIIFLGMEKGLPVFTLTAYWKFKLEQTSPPSSSYLKHIIIGIKQVYGFSNEKIYEYLNEKPGINGNFSRKKLLDIIQQP